jgi:tetratricopeptide (TPR) repeat protein
VLTSTFYLRLVLFWMMLLLLPGNAVASKTSDSLFILDILQRNSAKAFEKQLSQAKTKKDSIHCLIKLSLHGRYFQDAGRQFALQALRKSNQINYELGIGLSYVALSTTGSNFTEIDSLRKEASRIFEEFEEPNLVHIAELYAAFTLTNLGENYIKAFSLINQFLSDYTIKTDSSSYAIAWNLLGEIYRIIRNDVKALEYYKKAYGYSFIPSGLMYPAPMINIGTVYKNMGNYDSALLYYTKALAFDSTKRTSLTGYVYNRIAQVHYLRDSYSEALQYATESNRIYESLPSQQGLILASSTLSLIYKKINNRSESIRMGAQAVTIAQQINYYPEEVQEACLSISKLYEQNGNIQKALTYQKIYSEIREKIYGPDANLELFNEQLNLELKNQELEKKILSEKQRISENEASTQRTINLVIGVVLFLSLMGSFMVIRKNHVIEKLNLDLKNKNDEILTQAEELRAANEEVEAINANLESLVRDRSNKVIEQNKKLTDYAFFNAHKVRGPLARILGLINVFELELKNQSLLDYSEMLKEAGNDLDNSINDINVILEQDDSISKA